MLSQACSRSARVLIHGECTGSDVKKVLACARSRDKWEEDEKNNEECITDAGDKDYKIKRCLEDAGFNVEDEE